MLADWWRRVWIAEPDLGSDERWAEGFQWGAVGVAVASVAVYKFGIESLLLAYVISAGAGALLFWIGLHLATNLGFPDRLAKQAMEVRAADDGKRKRLGQLAFAMSLLLLPSAFAGLALIKRDPRSCEAWFGVPVGVVLLVGMVIAMGLAYVTMSAFSLRVFLHTLGHDVWPPPGYRGIRAWPVLRGRKLQLLRIGSLIGALVLAGVALYSLELLGWAIESAKLFQAARCAG